MKALPFLTLLALVTTMLSGCSSASPWRDAKPQPEFIPERFFDGRTVGRGEFRRILGGKPTPFDMVIEGRWRDGVLTMEETFTSDKGRWRRVWTISPEGTSSGGIRTFNARLTSSTHPFIALGSRGDTVWMGYNACAPLAKGCFAARFDQTLRLRPDGTVLNIADVYKFGVRIGRSTVVFHKAEAPA